MDNNSTFPFGIIRQIPFKNRGTLDLGHRLSLMRLGITLISFLILPNVCLSQLKLDSLLLIWQNEEQIDSLRFDAIHKIAFDIYLLNSVDSTIFYAEKHKEFASKKGDFKQLALALNTLGNAYSLKGNFIESISCYHQSLEIRKKINDKRGIAGSFINIGGVYSTVSQHSKAIRYYKMGIKVCNEIGEKLFKANAYGGIGNIYLLQKENERALEYFKLGLNAYEGTKHRNLSIILHAIGLIHVEMGNYDLANNYFNECYDFSKEMDIVLGQVAALGGIGKVFEKKEDFDKALEYAYRVEALLQSLGQKRLKAQWCVEVAIIYEKKGEHDKSLEYNKLGLKLATELKDPLLLKYTYENLYKIHKSKKHGLKALEYHELMTQYDDSLQLDETTKKLKEYEFETKLVEDSLAQVVLEQAKKQDFETLMNTKKRNNRIQYSLAVIVVILIASTIAVLTKYQISIRLAQGLIFIFFILTFEFLLVVLDPWVDKVSNGEVGWKIAINTAIAFVLFGIHQVSEKKLKHVIIK
ncbi:MAG: tetratricopeptide repeat protein [Bacteroidia bacterium]